MKEKKPLVYWDEVLDSIIVSDDVDSFFYDLTEEQAGLMNRKTFFACKNENMAHNYLNHAERILKTRGPLSQDIKKLLDTLRQDAEKYESYHVFARALRLFVTVVHAGTVPALATAEAEKKERSRRKRELKKWIMLEAIRNIFQKFPTLPKTLGGVWIKFDAANKNMIFENPKYEKGRFRVNKEAKGKDSVIITKDAKYYAKYSKRSLQHFINKLK